MFVVMDARVAWCHSLGGKKFQQLHMDSKKLHIYIYTYVCGWIFYKTFTGKKIYHNCLGCCSWQPYLLLAWLLWWCWVQMCQKHTSSLYCNIRFDEWSSTISWTGSQQQHLHNGLLSWINSNLQFKDMGCAFGVLQVSV